MEYLVYFILFLVFQVACVLIFLTEVQAKLDRIHSQIDAVYYAIRRVESQEWICKSCSSVETDDMQVNYTVYPEALD